MEPDLTPLLVDWQPGWACGDALLDSQHQALLAQCNRLGTLCQGGNADAFDRGFDELVTLAQQHFEAETAWLAAAGDPEAEAHGADGEEFAFLAADIATTAHFDRLELQRFLAGWWLGHVASSAPRLQALAAHAAGGTAAA